ncbi:MAG: nuclear transport factor 2 family protein [Crocinitomix sp.]|nr:nuclear transport factor 2 family protein [Crocinitomix sp.]
MKEVIEGFYTAFQNKDAEKMVSYYHDDIEFTDPAFGDLKGEHAKNMWRLLLEKSVDMKLDFSQVAADENTGKAHWDAHYTFSQTGRKVLNKIDAEFIFKDGKIIRHIDTFNLHTWAKQALGFKGMLLGGTGFFKRKLNGQTSRMLAKFENEKGNG